MSSLKNPTRPFENPIDPPELRLGDGVDPIRESSDSQTPERPLGESRSGRGLPPGQLETPSALAAYDQMEAHHLDCCSQCGRPLAAVFYGMCVDCATEDSTCESELLRPGQGLSFPSDSDD